MSNKNMTTKDTAQERANKRKNQVGKEMNRVLAGNGLVGNWVIAAITEMGKVIIELVKFVFEMLFDMVKFINSLLFGGFRGIFAGKNKYGPRYTYRGMRYLVTIFAPPVGIFCSKGMMGWFSMLICTILCMMNYFIGMIYAFVVMHSRGYAQRYENVQSEKAKKIQEDANYKHPNTFPILFVSLMIMLFLIVFMFGVAKVISDQKLK